MIDTKLISKYLENEDKYVFPFEIKEKQKTRKIITYNNDFNYGIKLRSIHERIRDEFDDNFCERNKNSFAYHKGIRCLDAIDDHLKSNHFIKLDIHHFFESITLDLFLNIYGSRFNNKWKEILSGCFYKGSLSIGFVTSPILSDYFMSDFDKAIEEYISNNPKLHYSRYSDDMLLSSEDNIEELNKLFDFVKTKLEEMGLELNEKKLKRVSISKEKNNSISFLGLNISKLDDINNKVTISKGYILFLLFLIEKNSKYNGKCRELVNEINSRVAYLYYNSLISYQRFQKKYKNIYGVEYEFIPHKPNDRNKPNKTSEIADFDEYTGIFEFNIHTKAINNNNAQIISSDCIEIVKYLGKDEEVIIPSFVESIGKEAFRGSNIKKITLSNSLKAIGDSAFFNCNSLEEIVLTDNISYIGESCFEGTKIKNIIIPKKVLILSKRAFANTALEKVELNNVKIIKEEAFIGCKELEEITLPTSITKLEKATFKYCEKLKSVTILGDLYDLPESTFELDYFLSNIKLNDSLLTIGSKAFYLCIGLKEIYIPKNVINIEASAFGGCKNLVSFDIDNENRVYDSRDNSHALIETNTNKLLLVTDKLIIPESIKIIGKNCFSNKLIKNIIFPKDLEKIEDNAFSNCRLLKEIIIPDSVTAIGEATFSGCISLEKVILSNKIEEIKDNTFNNCINLKSINIDNIKSIGKNAFNNNRSLDVKLPNNLIKISYKAFSRCYSIKELFISKSVKEINKFAFSCLAKTLDSIKVDKDNINYADYNSNSLIDKKKRTLFLGCKNSIIPEGIEAIDNGAFIYCKELKNITFPDSLKLINKNAFSDCISLKEINTNYVYKIEDNAFSNCYELENVKLNDALVSIGRNAFSNCKKLNSIILPNSINKYGNTIFKDCINLKSITFPDNYLSTFSIIDGCNNLESIIIDENNPNYSSLNSNVIFIKDYQVLLKGCKNSIIPEETRSISNNAFGDVLGLKTITIPDKVVTIGAAAFRGCSDLEEVILNDKLKGIDAAAFKNCEKLKKINLPKSLDRIEASAFENCISLEEIIIPEKITEIPSKLFASCKNLKTVKLPNTVKEIRESAFSDCESLSNINLDNVINFGKNAFSNCYKLNPNLSINIEKIEDYAFKNNPNIKNIKFNDKLNTFSNLAFFNCKLESIDIENSEITSNNNAITYDKSLVLGIGECIIPEGVEIIEPASFYNNQKIKKLVLPKSLKRICECAFEKSSIEEIVFNEGLTEIAFSAFKDCNNLKELILPESLNIIGDMAFSNCSNLKKIYIPNNVIHISNTAFYKSISNLDEIVVAKDNNRYTSYDSNILVDKKTNTLLLGSNKAILNNNIKVIHSNAFIGSKIKKLDIPESILYVSEKAFADCTNLEEISISKNLLNINKAFRNNYSLKKIIVDPNNLVYKVIDNNLIDINSNKLIFATNTNIPGFVEAINNHSFDYVKDIKELYISENIKEIGDLTSCNIDNITVAYDNPYYYSENNSLISKSRKELLLASNNTIIPDSVLSIKANSFSSAKNLKKLYIPKNISYIDSSAFNNIDLEEIIVDKDNRTYNSNNNVILTTKSNCLIYKAKNGIVPNNVNTLYEANNDMLFRGKTVYIENNNSSFNFDFGVMPNDDEDVPF